LELRRSPGFVPLRLGSTGAVLGPPGQPQTFPRDEAPPGTHQCSVSRWSRFKPWVLHAQRPGPGARVPRLHGSCPERRQEPGWSRLGGTTILRGNPSRVHPSSSFSGRHPRPAKRLCSASRYPKLHDGL